MKHLNIRTSLLVVLLFIFAADALAQSSRTFLVKEVSKKPGVILHQDKKQIEIAPRSLLPLSAMLTIRKGGKLVVYDNVGLSEYTIQEPGMNTLAKFLDGSNKASYTKVTFAGLIALLFSNEEGRTEKGTIYRGAETDPNSNSLEEYVTNIREVLSDSTIILPEGYATILNEVLEDIDYQDEVLADSVSASKE